MNVCELLPLKTTKKIASLTYYTILDAKIGDLVEITMNGQTLHALIVSVRDIKSSKTEIRAQDFKIKKINRILTRNFVDPDLIYELYNLSTLLCTSINNILNTLAPLKSLSDIKFVARPSDNTVKTHHIFPTRLELRKFRNTNPGISSSTPSIEFLTDKSINSIVINNENSRYYYSFFKSIDTKQAIIYIAKILNIKISYTYDLPSFDLFDESMDFEKISKQINILKMKDEVYLDKSLYKSIFENKENKKIILYTMRKGMYTQSVCRDCSQIIQCSKCNKPYTLIINKDDEHNEIRYHFCNTCKDRIHLASAIKCTYCKSWRIETLGIGTQGIEKYIFDNINITNNNSIEVYTIDGNITNTVNKIHKKYNEFLNSDNKSLLICTEQALPLLEKNIADFVVIISLDSAFYISDYNMDEKLFFIINKLRDSSKGSMYLQTRQSEKFIENNLTKICSEESKDFYKNELLKRKQNYLPPFYVILTFEAPLGLLIPNFLQEFKSVKIKIKNSACKYVFFIEKRRWSDDYQLRSKCYENFNNLNLKINSKELL